MAFPRRIRALVTATLAVTCLLVGCGQDNSPDTGASPAAAGAVFPLSVEHQFGTTVVERVPERVVTVGVTEQDTLLALGVVPVGVTEWYGEQPSATWPWAHGLLAGAEPEVLSTDDGFEYEKIAALRPDLIVGVNAGLEQDTYDRLSQIAPTVAQPKGDQDFFAPWDAQTLLIGQVVGKETEVTELIAGIKGQFADVAAAHPEFAGTKAVFLQAPYSDGTAIAYQDGLATDFLTDLGFVVPTEIDQFVPPGDVSQAYIPLENLGVLNAAEVLVWATEDDTARPELESQPIYRTLTPVQDGHLVFTDEVLAGAIYFTSPLSLPYVLDRLVPLLEQAVAGNPETVPAS